MEHIALTLPASRHLTRAVQVGVVASGDLEVLFRPAAESASTGALRVSIISAQTHSRMRWEHLFARIHADAALPRGELLIHDSVATPGVARLRIEQAFEEADHA